MESFYLTKTILSLLVSLLGTSKSLTEILKLNTQVPIQLYQSFIIEMFSALKTTV